MEQADKEACGGPVAPSLPTPPLSPTPADAIPTLDSFADMETDSKMDFYMSAILSRLDRIADKLEGSGMPRMASEVDEVSNSLGLLLKGGKP